jgi:thiol:disulfide interchange protein DsbC
VRFPTLSIAVLGVLLAVAVRAAEPPAVDPGQAATVPEGAQVLVERLTAVRPDLAGQILRVGATPLDGFYAIELPGGTMLYGSADGRHLIAGDLYALTANELVNLAEVERAEARHRQMADVQRDDMIVFRPAGPVKAAITVFTDVDCGYCQMLHRDVPELNARGIEVRYLAFPRGGVGSETYRKIVSAWCADDPNDAITRLKARQSIPQKSCDNPVAQQYELGIAVGVNGTPAIVLDDGRLLPGYLPVERLSAILGI